MASLQTAKYDEAYWLALFIKRRMEEDTMKMEYFVCGDTQQPYPTPLPAEFDAYNILAQVTLESTCVLTSAQNSR